MESNIPNLARSDAALEMQEAIAFDHSQRSWSPGSWLFLLLAMLVFTWGTSYKLSLYSSNPAVGIAPAKLCKLTSDNAKSQADQALDSHKAASPDLAFYVSPTCPLPTPVLKSALRVRSAMAGLAPLQAAPILHIRPPPLTDQRMLL
jgi:hypothetical protein